MTPETLLFALLVVAVLAVIYGVWRYWDGLVELSPEEEEFDRAVASLNQRQANRISDDQLTKPPSDEDAWQIMMRRGQRMRRRMHPEDEPEPLPTSRPRKRR
jgi:hypothetical protein